MAKARIWYQPIMVPSNTTPQGFFVNPELLFASRSLIGELQQEIVSRMVWTDCFSIVGHQEMIPLWITFEDNTLHLISVSYPGHQDQLLFFNYKDESYLYQGLDEAGPISDARRRWLALAFARWVLCVEDMYDRQNRRVGR